MFVKTRNIDKVSSNAANMFLSGAVLIRVVGENKYVVNAEDKYFMITKSEVAEGKEFAHLFSAGDYWQIAGKVISFMIRESGLLTFYFCVVTMQENTPAVVFRRNKNESILYVARQFKTNRFEKTETEIPKDDISEMAYNIAKGKALYFNKPIPNINFDKQINTLINMVKRSNIPENSSEAKCVPKPEGVSDDMCNKEFLLVYLSDAQKRFSRSQMYYSGVIEQMEKKIKSLVAFYKMIKCA